jgi:hypothetical protein
MDQHGEKEAENKSQGSAEPEQREESMDQRAGGYKAEGEEESAPAAAAGLLIIKEVVASGEEPSSPPALLAHHPCSLLQLLLRACAGCLGLHGHGGYCSGDDPKPDAVAAPPDAAAAAAAADSSSRDEGEGGGGGGDKANVSGKKK